LNGTEFHGRNIRIDFAEEFTKPGQRNDRGKLDDDTACELSCESFLFTKAVLWAACRAVFQFCRQLQ
jgi:hypothetical protein